MSAAPNQVLVEIDLGAEPIRGTLRGRDGHRQPFSGWFGLLSALHRAQGQHAEMDDGNAADEVASR
jgi:hypothetical protein